MKAGTSHEEVNVSGAEHVSATKSIAELMPMEGPTKTWARVVEIEARKVKTPG